MSGIDYRFEYLSGGFSEMPGAIVVTAVNAGMAAGQVQGLAYRGHELAADSTVDGPLTSSVSTVVQAGHVWSWEIPMGGQDQIPFRVVIRTTAKTFVPAIEFLYLDDNGHAAPRGFCWPGDFAEFTIPERVVPPVKPVGPVATE